ncbi:hypothetical protein [Ferrimonas marina]|uniref:Uncharacterized protein n=1 Tax=Ferrimonas marina TaxID=299255 RepID=A0A1M5X9Y2_9GAMM|nr:hypothetical protein [Ferrimonas marina]SHH96576.1 hypothetical protein SAMN02745129_3365 [Ferrimonas marina]
MMLFTMCVLCLTAFLSSMPMQMAWLKEAMAIICVLLVFANLLSALKPPAESEFDL